MLCVVDHHYSKWTAQYQRGMQSEISGKDKIQTWSSTGSPDTYAWKMVLS